MINPKKSSEITTGIRKRFEDGTSNFAHTKCYGYTRSQSGKLLINEDEATVVCFIFNTYLAGASIGRISKMLSLKNIPSPSGKDTWSRNAINKLLSNEKYVGRVILQKTTRRNGKQVANDGMLSKVHLENTHPPIISPEMFDAVHDEKQKRSNIIKTDEGIQRRATRYHSPQVLDGPSF